MTLANAVKAADALLEFIRKGGVLSVRTLGEEKVEAIELEVPADSGYVDKPLEELGLPAGTKLGAIARPDGSVLIPDANARILAGDRVVLFTKEGTVRKLEKQILAVKS